MVRKKKDTVTYQIDKCVDCPHAVIERDPEPDDWFCDDSEKLTCTQVSPYRELGGYLRPYETQDIEPPDWCPLRK